MMTHLILDSNILKFQLIVLSDSVLVARQLGICDTDGGLSGFWSDEKYCSLSCLLEKKLSTDQDLLTTFTNIISPPPLFFSFFNDLFCVVCVTEQFLEL